MLQRPLPALFDDLHRAAIDELHARLAEEGYDDVRPSHGCVFRFIDEEGSRLTDLADRARLTKQAVGEFVSDLEELGYVERVPDPRDGRAKTVRLTRKGVEAQAFARSVFDRIERRWAAEVGEAEMATVREALEALCAETAVPA